MAYRPGKPGIPGGPEENLPHQPGKCLSARHAAQAAPANQPGGLLGFHRVGAGPARRPAEGHALDPSLADLHYRGYSVVKQANASSPELPDYNRIAASKQIWRDLEGYYTRYGDVRELLAASMTAM
jgi:hypothetical protein